MRKYLIFILGLACFGSLNNRFVPSLINNYHNIDSINLVIKSKIQLFSQDMIFRTMIDCSNSKVIYQLNKKQSERLIRQNTFSKAFNRVQGTVYLLQKDCYKAINLLNNVVSNNSKDQLAYFWLGKAYYDSHQDAHALQAWQNVDNLERYLVDLGWRLYLERNVKEAIRYLLWAIHLEPNSGQAASFLAYIYWDEGQNSVAYNWSLKADLLGASDPMVYIGPCRYFLWSNVDFKKASYWCNRGIEHFPRSTWLWYLQGWIYLQMNDIERALLNFQNSRSTDPKNRDAHLMIGRLLAKRQIAEAIKSYQAAIMIDPSYSVAICELADIYLVINQQSQARSYFGECLKLDPMNNHAKEKFQSTGQ